MHRYVTRIHVDLLVTSPDNSFNHTPSEEIKQISRVRAGSELPRDSGQQFEGHLVACHVCDAPRLAARSERSYNQQARVPVGELLRAAPGRNGFPPVSPEKKRRLRRQSSCNASGFRKSLTSI